MLQAVHGSPVLTGDTTPEPRLTSAVARAWAGLGWLGALHTFRLIFCTLSSGVGGDTKAPIGGPGMPPHTPAPQSEILQGKYNGIHMRPEPGLSSAVAKAWVGLGWLGGEVES